MRASLRVERRLELPSSVPAHTSARSGEGGQGRLSPSNCLLAARCDSTPAASFENASHAAPSRAGESWFPAITTTSIVGRARRTATF